MRPFAATRGRRLVPAVAGLVCLMCYQTAVRVPGELVGAPRLEVSGRGKRLAFGEYETVPGGWSGLGRAAAYFVADVLRATVEEPIEFAVRASGQDVWMVHCAPIEPLEEAWRRNWSLGQRLSCTLRPAGSDSVSVWRLTMETVPYQIPGGWLAGPRDSLQVVGATQNERGQVEGGAHPLGYYLRESGRVVAAVEVFTGRAVWLHPELGAPRRDVIAAAIAALLIWDRLIS